MGIGIFGTAGVRGGLDTVTPSLVARIGEAVGRTADSVVVGRDGRHTGASLTSAFVVGAESAGCDVLFLGEVPTHVVAWMARERGAYGAAITASHNPPEDNGVKLFRNDGREFGEEDERRVGELVESEPDTAEIHDWTEACRVDPVDEYIDAAVEYVEGRGDTTKVDGLRLAVDTANGVGVETTPPVLECLGAEVVAINAQVDPMFPGRGSKPTPESLDDFVDFVRRRDFDLGIAHDGDADRVVFVDDEGVVSEDAVLAVLAREYAPGTVLTTPNTSPRVDDAVAEAGGEIERVPLGEVSQRTRGRDVAFSAEPWKHVFTEFGGWVDGTVTAAEVTRLHADDPGVFDGLRDVNVRKRSVECPDEFKAKVMESVEEDLRDEYAGNEFDTTAGVRVALDDRRWFLVRKSGTEPVVRVYAEGEDSLVESLVGTVEDAVSLSRA